MNLDLSVKGELDATKGGLEEMKGKCAEMEKKAAKWDILFVNLVFRQGMVGLNNTLAKKELGNQARSHYPTLYCVKAHVAKMGNKKYKRKLKSILSQAGWTRKLDDDNKKLKKKYNLNSYAHPNVSRETLEWAVSVFMKGKACISRANHCQVLLLLLLLSNELFKKLSQKLLADNG